MPVLPAMAAGSDGPLFESAAASPGAAASIPEVRCLTFAISPALLPPAPCCRGMLPSTAAAAGCWLGPCPRHSSSLLPGLICLPSRGWAAPPAAAAAGCPRPGGICPGATTRTLTPPNMTRSLPASLLPGNATLPGGGPYGPGTPAAGGPRWAPTGYPPRVPTRCSGEPAHLSPPAAWFSGDIRARCSCCLRRSLLRLLLRPRLRLLLLLRGLA
jgi:hypothetical protein